MFLSKAMSVVVLGLSAIASSAFAQEPIKIGAVLSVTGPATYGGDPQLKTLTMQVEAINAAGGVLGRKLILVHYDDASEAAKANAFAKRLIESDKVDLIVGGTTTGATLAMVPLIEKAEIPFISVAGAAAVVEPVKKWTFKTPHTDRMAAERVLDDMRKRGFERVALLSETSGFGQSGRKETLAVADKFGITIVNDETFGTRDTDLTAQLVKVRATPDVHALMVFGSGPAVYVGSKNITQIDMKVPVYQSHGSATEEYIKLTGASSEGHRAPSPALLIANDLASNDPQKKVVSDFKKSFEAAHRSDASSFGGYAYDALLIAVDSFKRAGSTDKAKVRDAIEQTRGLVGTSGVYNMSPTDHMGLDASAFRLVEVKRGKWAIVP